MYLKTNKEHDTLLDSESINKIINSFIQQDSKTEDDKSKGLECIISVNNYVEYENIAGGGFFSNEDKFEKAKFEKGKIFDIGNLTGIIFTALLTLHAESIGILNLNHRVSRILQGFGANGKEEMTIRHLLLNQSGLPETINMHRILVKGTPDLDRLNPRRSTIQLLQNEIFRTRLLNLPGKVTLYSSLNYLVLGFILEQVFGMSISKLIEEKIVYPLKLRSFSYIDYEALRREGVKVNSSDIVPTIKCNWRGKTIVGETQDEMSWALGGVSSYCGLFSSLLDLQSTGQFVLQILNNTNNLLGVDGEVLKEILPKEKIISNNTESIWYGATSNTGVALYLDPLKNIVLTNGSNITQTSKDIKNFQQLNGRILELL